MSSTWSGSLTLGPDQVAVAYTEVDIVNPSTVVFTLSVDEPTINLTFSWDGQGFTHSGDPSDQVVGVHLLNMTLPGDDCCEVWVKYITGSPVTSAATWSIISGDGVLEHPSLTIE